MGIEKIFRKRIIPAECRLLEDDEIVYSDESVLVTKWKTLNPKTEFSHGSSVYDFEKGIKVSKFYRDDDSLLYWYIDIVEFSTGADKSELIVTDLLADVIISPSGKMKVVDLDEFEQALKKELLTMEDVRRALLSLDSLLTTIYDGKFDVLKAEIESRI